MKKIVCVILIIGVLATFFGCRKQAQQPPTVQTQASTDSAVDKPADSAESVIAGTDVFGGKHFDEMLWGYYEASVYDYTGDTAVDTAAFREDMDYLKVSSKYGELQMSALPLDIQLGSYSQFMNAFFYEGKYYSPYTEKGKAMFRKSYMEKFGDLTEEGFQKIEKLLELNVAQMTLAEPDGNTQVSTFAYEIRDSMLTLYHMSVDEKYNAAVGDVYARYDFLHDGGKLILDYNGIRREYLASGYKEADKGYLRVAGFAQDRSKQYENLEGFILYEQQEGEGFQIDVTLSNNARPVDPVATFDKITGDFSLTWTKSAYLSGEIQHNVPREISGKIVPCTNYGFNGFSGFYLLIDGTCYSYLVSEDEYKERKYTNLENGDVISDLQREKLAQIKISMLAELEQAYEIAEIPVGIDFVRGQIALEADRLFGTDSQDISTEGQDFLQRFMEIYASVISKEEYSKYVSRIVIEGHTDTAGSYSQKQALSMSRADTVAKRCVEISPDLGKDIQFAGCAYDYPIYNDDGAVNADESNRMVFRFLLAAN